MNKYAEPKKYAAIALDPIHIGAGGYRLGRADNTIVRDPATDVPKIPGTSLSGAIRAYAEIVKKEDESLEENNKKEDESLEENNKKFKNIIIEEIFGTEKDGGRQGMLRFYDAQIIFFPVSSIQGTVWITTKELLENWFGELKDINGEKLKIPEKNEDNAYILKGINNSKPLNLGWLMLDTEVVSDGKEVLLPEKINNFAKRIVAVSDKLFSHIINDNLEVRTSVRIDSDTGTAVDGALFTYEAIPRGTVLGFEIVFDNRNGNQNKIDNLLTNVFSYLKLLGVGGMSSRGFGRMEVVPLNKNNVAVGGGE